MKNLFLKQYKENLVKAVKADLDGRPRDADFLFGTASGMMTSAYIMFDYLGTDVVAKMSRALDLAYDIAANNVVDKDEALWILENDMA